MEPPNIKTVSDLNMNDSNAETVASALFERFRHEGLIIRERIRMFLTFEGFLFAALAVSIKAEHSILSFILVFLGIAAAIPTYVSIRISYVSTEELSKKFELIKLDGDIPPLPGYDVGNKGGIYFLPEVFLPLAIVIAWIIIGTVISCDFYF